MAAAHKAIVDAGAVNELVAVLKTSGQEQRIVEAALRALKIIFTVRAAAGFGFPFCKLLSSRKHPRHTQKFLNSFAPFGQALPASPEKISIPEGAPKLIVGLLCASTSQTARPLLRPL